MALIDDIVEQVRELTPARYLETKAEIVKHYKAEYGKSWRGPLVRALAPITGMKEKNLQRRFDPSRLNNVPKRAAEKQQYKELGRTLPPDYIPPPGGFRVTFNGEIRISQNCWPRAFVITLTGADAERFARFPSLSLLMSKYFKGHDISEGFCGDPFFQIEAA